MDISTLLGCFDFKTLLMELIHKRRVVSFCWLFDLDSSYIWSEAQPELRVAGQQKTRLSGLNYRKEFGHVIFFFGVPLLSEFW
jgi:hypothetical protein